jgi:hypothetical protein
MLLYNAVMPQRKLNLVRFTVNVTPEVKDKLDQLAVEHGRSLAVEAGRWLEQALRQAGQLPGEPDTGVSRPAN